MRHVEYRREVRTLLPIAHPSDSDFGSIFFSQGILKRKVIPGLVLVLASSLTSTL